MTADARRYRDDIAESVVEETFGTVVVAADNPALYSAIAASNSWPVEVDVVDVEGIGRRGACAPASFAERVGWMNLPGAEHSMVM